jgi:hypothetical protein
MRALALIACLCSGCLQFGDPQDDAQDMPPSPAPFAGTWMRVELEFDCTRVLIFGKDSAGSDAYEIDLLCALNDGGLGLQAEAGSYTVDSEGKTTFTPRKATCARVAAHQATLTEVEGQVLRVATPTGIEAYERTSPWTVPSGVTLGCFDASGRFEQRPLTDM